MVTPVKKPKLSVIVASRNLGRFLEPTLDSIFTQDYKDFECILIDGASTDDTLERLKKYPQVRWISEKDTCYMDAFCKGLAMAQGEYITQCAVSDGYVDPTWLRKSAEVLDRDKEVSLVWGVPQCMDEDGKMLAVSKQFYKDDVQKERFFYFYLAAFFWLPEGNFVVRTNVMKKCFPEFKGKESLALEPWLEFSFEFQAQGYLPYFLPIIANYGRIHDGQLGQREYFSGVGNKKLNLVLARARALRKDLLTGKVKHVYRDGDGNPLPYMFSVKRFLRWEILHPAKLYRNTKDVGKRGVKKVLYTLESKHMMPEVLKRTIAAKRKAKLGIVE